MAHNETPIEPSAGKTKPATSNPKYPAVAAAGSHPAKFRAQPANKNTVIVPKPSPKRQAIPEPQSTPESTSPPLISGAAPPIPVGSFVKGKR